MILFIDSIEVASLIIWIQVYSVGSILVPVAQTICLTLSSILADVSHLRDWVLSLIVSAES